MLKFTASANEADANRSGPVQGSEGPPSPPDNTSEAQECYEDGYAVDEPTRMDVQVKLARTVRKYTTDLTYI